MAKTKKTVPKKKARKALPKAKPTKKLKTQPKSQSSSKARLTKSKKAAKATSKKSSKALKKQPIQLRVKAKAVSRESTSKVNAKKQEGLQPTGDRILVRRLESLSRTPGGLFIPDTALEKPNSGEVVAVGRGRMDKKGRIRPFDVKPGDRVLFNSFSGTEIELSGERYLIMRETDLLGIKTQS